MNPIRRRLPWTLLLLAVFAVGLLSLSCEPIFAQSPPAAPSAAAEKPPTIQQGLQTIIDAIGSSNTNWDFAIYGINAPKLDRRWGAGVGAFHEVTPYIVAGLRMEFLDGGFVMPDGTATLQLPLYPVKAWPWLVVTPFTYAGIGIPVSGGNIGNTKIPGKNISTTGEPLAILGAGGAVKIAGGKAWSLNLAGDIEKWPSLIGRENASVPGNEYRAGLILNKTF